jgi:hypothetical protein
MKFTPEQLKIVYNAVRYYQINRVPLNSKLYENCDEILKHLFDDVHGQENQDHTVINAS